jgi:hypothetical protein
VAFAKIEKMIRLSQRFIHHVLRQLFFASRCVAPYHVIVVGLLSCAVLVAFDANLEWSVVI